MSKASLAERRRGKGRRVLQSVSSFFTAIILTILSAAPACAEANSNIGGIDLSQYRGKVVYLDFWASWCGPCAQSFPYMQNLESKFGGHGLEIIAVNVDHSRLKADEFVERMKSRLPVVYDSKGEIAKSFNIKTMPTAVLIDRNGDVAFVHVGFKTEDEEIYTNHVKELLNAVR